METMTKQMVGLDEQLERERELGPLRSEEAVRTVAMFTDLMDGVMEFATFHRNRTGEELEYVPLGPVVVSMEDFLKIDEMVRRSDGDQELRLEYREEKEVLLVRVYDERRWKIVDQVCVSAWNVGDVLVGDEWREEHE